MEEFRAPQRFLQSRGCCGVGVVDGRSTASYAGRREELLWIRVLESIPQVISQPSVCVYINIQIHIYHILLQTCANIYIYKNIYTHMYIYIHIWRHADIHRCMSRYRCMIVCICILYTSAYTYVHIQYMYICICIIHTYFIARTPAKLQEVKPGEFLLRGIWVNLNLRCQGLQAGCIG